MAVGTAAVLGAAGINSATSGGTSYSGSSNAAQSSSRVYGTEASNRATQAAINANSAANAAWDKAAAYNAEQAAINRAWQEHMANTVYQRTVADMKAAGINPVLAASMGLGTAGSNSGATAQMGNPMSYMANTYADSMSASQSHGSSWSESISGIAYLADALKGLAEGMTSAFNVNIAIDGLKSLVNDDAKTGDGKTVGDHKSSGDYDKPISKVAKDWILDPEQVAKDVLNYITTKNSGGMIKPPYQ